MGATGTRALSQFTTTTPAERLLCGATGRVRRAILCTAAALLWGGVWGQLTPAGTEFQVNTYTVSSQYRPAVAADAAGNFVVAWSSYTQDGSGSGTFAQRYQLAMATNTPTSTPTVTPTATNTPSNTRTATPTDTRIHRPTRQPTPRR